MSSCFLFVNENDSLKKINIDDLYENNHKRDLKQISIFNKILNRVQNRIQITGRNKKNAKYIWFTIPEYIFGEPLYDKGECIAYVVTKLEENGFFIKYIHPNTLFVSWENWVPTYLRTELKKRLGIVVDEKGNRIDSQDEKEDQGPNKRGDSNKKDQKQYTPIGNYKPTGNLVYNQEVFEKLEKRIEM
jgi:hypothetical protein